MALDLFINDGTKTKEELLKEVKILRAQLAVLEETEAKRKRLEEEIKTANEHLEHRILERTRELVETNKELRIKIKAHRQALDVFKESEEKYRKLIECANDAIFIADIESGLIMHANKKAEELIGASLNEIVGMHFTELHPKEEADKYKFIFIEHVQKGTAISEELYVCHRDGQKIPIEISASVIEIGGKKVIQGIFRDLRRWKQSENALLEAQRKLSTLIDNLPGIAYRCANDKNWTMEYLSEGCYELTGYKAEELIGNRVVPYNSLIFLEDQLKVWKSVQNAILKKQPYIIEYRIKSKSNEEKWVWEKGCCIYGARGEALALEGFISDITERKKLQSELEQAIQREKQEREISSIDDLANFSNSSDVTAKLFSIAPLYESRPGIFDDLVKRYENLVDLAANESSNRLSPIILDELHFIGRQIITLKASHNDVMEMHSRVMKIKNRQGDSKKAEVCTEKGRIMILELMCFLVSAYRKQLLISKEGSLQRSG